MSQASVLIVDDDERINETLSDLLGELGHNVEVAGDGYEAIDKVKAHMFDVVLMDIRMPGIDGVETYKEIKVIRPEATVMMMTAYSVEELVAEALEEGAYGVMYKPIDIEKVIDFIEHVEKNALILIVDDELPTCETLIDVLEEKGHRVARASTGEEAIEMVKERGFDLAFIDLAMPGMNGVEVFRALKEVRPSIKVIIMTGYRQVDWVQNLIDEAQKNNACGCIYKPFTPKSVFKLIEGIVN